MSEKEDRVDWGDYYAKTREERIGALTRIDQTSNWSITITAIVSGTALLRDGPPLLPLAGLTLLRLPLYLEADRYRYFVATDEILRRMHARFLLNDGDENALEKTLRDLVTKYDQLELNVSFRGAIARRMKRVYAIQFYVLIAVGVYLAVVRLPAWATVMLFTIYGSIGLFTTMLVFIGWKPMRRQV